ncbi:MAG: low molecular weight phosphatase family protein [Gordonia polyisoprenivorans]|nr:low molecular weight phosphatase family protein [Gordonia polyisoprenivorans]
MTANTPSVLFVCVKNGGKSQMAAGLMRAAAGEHVDVHSAGTAPGTAVNPQSAASLLEVGVDISDEHPKPIDPDLIARMDRVITLGREATIDNPPDDVVIEHWDTDEPSLRGIDGMARMRLIRDDINRRVQDLAHRLTSDPTHTDQR